MLVRTLGLTALLLSIGAVQAATVLHFDEPFLTPGSVVPAGYSPLVTFSVPTGGLFVYSQAGFWQTPNPPASMPNIVCPTANPTATSAFCTEQLNVSFAQPVNALSFWAGAWDDIGSVMVVRIFVGSSIFAGQIQVTSPQQLNTQGIVRVSELSGIANITGLQIISPSSTLSSGRGDTNGLVYDNFQFDLPVGVIETPLAVPVVPEPSTVGLAVAGLAALAARRFRRS